MYRSIPFALALSVVICFPGHAEEDTDATRKWKGNLIYYEEALKKKREAGDQEAIARALTILGIAHHSRGEFKRALSYYQESFDIHKATGDEKAITADLENLELVFWNLGAYRRSLLSYEGLLNMERGTGNIETIASNLADPPKHVFTSWNLTGFAVIGARLRERFVELGDLKPGERVLDIGSGIGRMAIPLTKYLGETGSYEGFDIHADGVNWCKRMISPEYPNFQFRLENLV